MISFLRKITPKPILQFYHLVLAGLAVFLYNNPSKKMIVIGITGTNGKSSTVQFTAQLLTMLGNNVGYTTTAGFCIAGKEIENRLKMTMPGRFILQSLLSKMERAKCEYVIVETSSQGITQFRHLGLNYDVVAITNLTPEHIEAHGGFEVYKKAKGELFAHLTRRKHKIIAGKKIKKVTIVNADDKHASYFSSFPADIHLSYGWVGEPGETALVAQKSTQENDGAHIRVNNQPMVFPFVSGFEQKNVFCAVAIVYSLGYSLERIASVCAKLKPIPGRFERIKIGQPFEVIVDYAYEPYALQALFSAVKTLSPKRLIGVHGSAGGGRDIGRREIIGKLAAENEDIVIVTNEDPYDEDPRSIIDQVAKGAEISGKVREKNLFLINDRDKAIEFAISKAQDGDAVLLTGKGSEVVMAVKNRKSIPWSDKQVAIDALKAKGYGR